MKGTRARFVKGSSSVLASLDHRELFRPIRDFSIFTRKIPPDIVTRRALNTDGPKSKFLSGGWDGPTGDGINSIGGTNERHPSSGNES